MPEPLKLAVAGLGRIGAIHSMHAAELAAETGDCRLVAVVDANEAHSRSIAEELSVQQGSEVAPFATVEALIEAGTCDATVVCTPTDLHRAHTTVLVEAGQRVLLEKPLTESLSEARDFAAKLEAGFPEAVMLAFQRRFDEPLIGAKQLCEQGAIGRRFKIVSVLEDSAPLPQGYVSPGLFASTSVHNVDEVLWLSGKTPLRAVSAGSLLFGHRSSLVQEDFDDGLTFLWFPDDLIAQITVSRNHVSGYRIETWIFGEEGHIHVGRFEQNKKEVILEAYGRSERIEYQAFPIRDYGRPVPEFVERFGLAYKQELAEFVRCCRQGCEFPVTHREGLRAMEVIDAGLRGAVEPSDVKL